MAISNPTKYVTTRRLGRFKEKNDALYAAKTDTYTKAEVDAMKGPVYDEDNRGVIFPSTSASTYDSARRCVVVAV